MTDIDKAKVGQVGEAVAAEFLKKHGYQIVEQNYRKKWGELDIVAKDSDEILHFIEVKAISVKLTLPERQRQFEYMPEDNIRAYKKQRMSRAIRTYFLDRNLSDEIDFQIDVIAVFLDFDRKKARVRFLENVILE